jgi:hypothetical protein
MCSSFTYSSILPVSCTQAQGCSSTIANQFTCVICPVNFYCPAATNAIPCGGTPVSGVTTGTGSTAQSQCHGKPHSYQTHTFYSAATQYCFGPIPTCFLVFTINSTSRLLWVNRYQSNIYHMSVRLLLSSSIHITISMYHSIFSDWFIGFICVCMSYWFLW